MGSQVEEVYQRYPGRGTNGRRMHVNGWRRRPPRDQMPTGGVISSFGQVYALVTPKLDGFGTKSQTDTQTEDIRVLHRC